MKWLYAKHKEKQGVVSARSLVRDILEQNNGNISKAAQILWCSRKCVRRARDGKLEDRSRAPKTPCKHQTSSDLENLILLEREKCKYGRIRLAKHLHLKYGILFSSSTIWDILKRNKVKKHTYKRARWSSKPLYDYENIRPFEYWQVDTKHIEDFEALWELCFIPRKYNLPLYQWSYIDAKTKYKFIAYSHTLCSDFGLMFILTIATFLRANGIDYHMKFQGDNWPADFCWGSKRKEEEWNKVLKNINCSFISIPAWKKYLQGIVERSHRTDDEELYRPYLGRIKDMNSFLYHSSKYIHTYNCYRPSFGIWMNWLSPLEKLEKTNILHPTKFNEFPVFILESLVKIGGTYLKDHYQNIFQKISPCSILIPERFLSCFFKVKNYSGFRAARTAFSISFESFGFSLRKVFALSLPCPSRVSPYE